MDHKQNSKILSKDFILLFIYMALICMAMNMLNVIVPLYVVGPLESTTSMVGIMTTIYIAASCISRPFNNVLVEKFGRRKIMILGIGLMGISVLIAGLIPSLFILGILRALMGVGYSAGSTACNTASTDIIPKSRLASGLGYFGISQSVGNAAGSPVATVIITWAAGITFVSAQGFSLVTVSVVCFLGLIVSLFILYEKRPGYKIPAPLKNSSSAAGISKYIEKSALPASIYEFATLFFVTCIMNFITLYVRALGLPEGVTGMFFLISSLIIIFIRTFLSHLMEKVPSCVLMIPGYISLIAACILLPNVQTAGGIYLAAVLYGIEHGIVWMALASEAVKKAAPEKRGTANATFYIAFDAAIGTGALVWGMLIDAAGYQTCFRIVSIACIVLAVGSVFLFHKKPHSDKIGTEI